METNFQKIQKLISSSDLTAEEQDKFLELLLRTTDEELKPLAELFAEDSNWIRKICDNYKAKQAVFAAKDNAAWEEVLKGEDNLFQELMKDEIAQ